MKEGIGTYTFANGNKFVGNFKNGKKDGSGILYYIDGSFEEGKWKDDSFVEISDQVNEIDQVNDIDQ